MSRKGSKTMIDTERHQMKNSVKTSNASNFRPLFTSMSRNELRALATSLNVPRGKSNKDTIANLEKAIADGKANVKGVFTVSFKPADGSASRVTYFGKTLRTYVSGPGQGDETWLTPDNKVSGSPADTSENDAEAAVAAPDSAS